MDRTNQVEIVAAWLQDLSAALNVPLNLNNEGVCTFQVGEDTIAIEVMSDLPLVCIYSPLLKLPIEDKELAVSFLERALEINAFQILTRGGSIASTPGGGLLIYCYSFPIEEADSEKFSKILGNFFDALPELKNLFSSTPFTDLKKESILSPKHLKV